jgi:hypothetical protein
MKVSFGVWLLFCVFFAMPAFAQDAGVKTVSTDDFSFDYPADWRLADKSSDNVLQYNLMPPSGNVLIKIISLNEKVGDYELFNRVRTQTAQSFADKLYARFNETGKAEGTDVCSEINSTNVPGNRIRGVYEKSPSTAEFFYFSMNKRFFNFTYLRDDAESAKADAAWNTITKSFKVKDFNFKKPDFILDAGNDAVLNTKALKLVMPSFPENANVSSTVKVRIIIDETGKVISARSVSGSQTYFPYAETAAKASKFAPGEVCGKPSKITGFITYRFDARP